MKPNRYFFLILLGFLLAMACSPSKPAESHPPNVLIIFPDQYRNYSLGIWSKPGYSKYLQGNPDPVSTPALDKLSAEGIVFSRAVSNYPLCSPFRAMLLSGMYPDHNGVTTNCRKDRTVSLRTDATCLTDVLSQAGYDVSYFGKCHWLKNEPLFDEAGTYRGSIDAPGGHYMNGYDTYIPPGPDRHSIDYFFQSVKDEHFNPRIYSSDPLAIEGKKDGEMYLPKRFSAEIESEKIIDYLANTHGQRDSDKPFLMIWSLNPPHNPWTEKSTQMDFFDQYTESGKVNLQKLLTRQNADTSVGHYAPYYFANVSAVDHYIGRVMDQLEASGLMENTLIIFTSDHGEMLGSHGRRGKNVPEIESYNIPFFLKWGNKLTHRVEDLIISVPDVMPTILGLAGFSDKIPEEVQGNNYASILLHPDPVPADKSSAALYMGLTYRGVYTGKYMMVLREENGQTAEIFAYDNEADPYQLSKIPFKNLPSEIGETLKGELEHLLTETNDRWYQQKICADFLAYP